MNETKWTPGPWIVDWEWPNNKYRAHTAISGAVGQPEEHRAMAQVVTQLDGEAYREGAANARLIAAAPDMAEALARAVNTLAMARERLEQAGFTSAAADCSEDESIARSALAKARGET